MIEIGHTENQQNTERNRAMEEISTRIANLNGDQARDLLWDMFYAGDLGLTECINLCSMIAQAEIDGVMQTGHN